MSEERMKFNANTIILLADIQNTLIHHSHAVLDQNQALQKISLVHYFAGLFCSYFQFS